MNKIMWLCLCLVPNLFCDKNLFLIDQIDAVIFGVEDTTIITRSETERPSLDGEHRSLKDIIFEKLLFQEGMKYKITPDSSAIDRYIANVQREHGLSMEQLEQLFTSVGYTFEEGRQQLGIMFAANSVLDFAIKSRLTIDEKDVKSYYESHPVYTPSAYQLRYMRIPFTKKVTNEKLKKAIEKRIAAGKDIPGRRWSDSFWIDAHDVAEEKQFIHTMHVGSISMPVQTDTGFELFFLVGKKEQELLSLEDRYKEIVNALRRPKYDQLFQEYKKSLFNQTSIKYFTQ